MMHSKTFPLRHISVRVPWHDAGWNATICGDPRHNTACLKLLNIAQSKDEAEEEALAGKSLRDVDPDKFPPCVKERGTFMASFDLERFHQHPYAKTSKDTHGHFRPTRLHYPAYSVAALPFRWMRKDVIFGDAKKQIRGLVEDFPLNEADQAYETTLPFSTGWLQDHINHRALLDCFWNHVQTEESLVFLYAKQVPLVEDTGRRVIVGVGRVKKIGPLTEYDYDGKPDGKIRSLIWERMVSHSIRPDFGDGFLLPYHEALIKSEDGTKFDPAEVVAFAPEDRFTEFSYATELVSSDAAISALMSCRAALLRASELFNINIRKQEQWIDRELGRLWKKRGAFPGLGAVLSATGIGMGNFIAHALTQMVGDDGNPWQAWDTLLSNPGKFLAPELARNIGSTIAKSWQRMPKESRSYLELLSRIDLSQEQASILAVAEQREEHGISVSDAELLANPYLLYEATRLTGAPLGLSAVDRGLFPSNVVREKFPIAPPTEIETPVDARRLRALVIRNLEYAALIGDTLRPVADVITALRRTDDVDPDLQANVTTHLIKVAEEENFAGEIVVTALADGTSAYQLARLAAVGDVIRSTVVKRVEQGQRLELKVSWRAELDALLGPIKGPDTTEGEKEERARAEKSAALSELAASRFSVLIGPAGTGKTTLLSVLCRQAEVQKDGILMLAPTGKARVRMEDLTKQAGTKNFSAKTLAQFLSSSGRYAPFAQRYLLTGKPGDKVARTVIVDECSMLTEEMMAALLEALSGVHRLIFVGDPRQLPPIGAGRPFADIIAELQPEDLDCRFPRVGKGYAELTVPRRQGAGEREDLQLAAWFGGSALSPGEDQVFEILAGKRSSETIEFVQWDSPAELEALLPKTLARVLAFAPDKEEWQSFAQSFGANLDANGSAWFNSTYKDRKGAGAAAEAWQILSPVRQKPWGCETLNRLIHIRYKGHQIAQARTRVRYRSIPVPMGDAQIIYGDKVINNRNWSVPASRVYPKPDARGFLANGEIGMVVGHRRTQKLKWDPDYMAIEFSTQLGAQFKFFSSDFSDEGEASLDLAYALTVHKSQGSEFGVVFLVLPRAPLMLTRELLYTALTRQKQKVIILHQGSATDLQKLSSERFSATATRLTNLFGPPRLVKVNDRFLEQRLIHNTIRGEAVRSKSEVIIANLLHSRSVDYHYEQPLELGGVVKYPDFTIEDDDTGKTYYWEHCGMLHDPSYRSRWNEKLAWYKANNILPMEDGGGSAGTLVVTVDQADGGIDSAFIDKRIAEMFG
jgi:hypothetical protein